MITISPRLRTLLGVAVIALGVGSGLGYLIKSWQVSSGESLLKPETRLMSSNATDSLISPLLDCSNSPQLDFSKVKDIQSTVELWPTIYRQQGFIKDFSFYFRDLKTGQWFGMEPEKFFIPANLFRILVVIGYFKRLETDPGLFDRVVETGEFGLNPEQVKIFFKDSKLELHKKYKVRELLDPMITVSDNLAYLTLNETHPEFARKVVQDLGLRVEDPKVLRKMNVMDYALVFRVLYNATYLTPESSQKVLSLLTEMQFKIVGMRFGLPDEVKSATLSGNVELGNGEFQLHQCGIIYAPGNPYEICVMTSGKNYEKMMSFISEISKSVLQKVMTQSN